MKITVMVVLSIFALAGAKSVVKTFDAPSGDISGLGWNDDILWAVDALNKKVYKIDPSSGDVTGFFTISVAAGYQATGLAVQNGYVYIGAWNNKKDAYVYKYNCSGSYLGSVNMCGG